MLGYDDGVGREDDCVVLGEDVQGGAVLVSGFVGRVEEYDVGGALIFDHRVQELADAAVFDGVAALQLERGDVGADREDGFGFALGEPAEVRAAAEGFNANRAGAGVEVGELCALNARGQDVEESFAETVAGGAGFEALGGLEDSGAECSGYDAHQFLRIQGWWVAVCGWWVWHWAGAVALRAMPTLAAKKRRRRWGTQMKMGHPDLWRRTTIIDMIRSSIPIGRFLGIDLRIHVSFPLLLALAIGYSLVVTGSASRGIGLWLALLFAVVVREVARTIAVAYSELRLRALFLLPVGGVMALVQRAPGTPGAATLPRPVTLVAPIANFSMGLLMMALSYAVDPHVPLIAQPWISINHVLRSFIWLQFLMGAVNLLPTATVPSKQMFRQRTAKTDSKSVRSGIRTPTPAFGLGTGIAISMILGGFLLMSYWPLNLWLILLGGFLLLGAHIKVGQALNENDADAILVSDVMLTEFTLLSSSDTLQGALARTVHSLQDVFPVVRGDRLVGSVSRQTIANNLQANGDSYLQGAMTRGLQLASPEEKVVVALRRAAAQGASEFIPVVEGSAMLGILTPQSLSRAVHQVKQTRARTELRENQERD